MERIDAEQAPYVFTESVRRLPRGVANEYGHVTRVRFPRLHSRPLPLEPEGAPACDQISKAVKHLEEVGRRREVPSRTTLYFEGDPARFLHFVCQGRLKLSLLSHKGHSVIVRFAFDGDLLGLSAVLNHAAHEFIAQTVEPASLISVARNAFFPFAA